MLRAKTWCAVAAATSACLLTASATAFAATNGAPITLVPVGSSSTAPYPLEKLKAASAPPLGSEVQTVPGPQAPPTPPAAPPPALAKTLAGLPKPNGSPTQAEPAPASAESLPDSDTSPLGGLSPDDGTPGGGYFTCDQTWEWIAAEPSGFVIGNCNNGAYLNRTEYDEDIGPEGYNWDGGQIYGDFGGNCGWLHADSYVTTGSFANCYPASTPQADYIYQAGGTYYIWTSTNGMDGVEANNPEACTEYADYYPWTSSAIEAYPTGHSVPMNGDYILIRYLALYESSDGSGYYVMAHDPVVQSTYGDGGGDWIFIPASCLA
jgi:hypothetical protein